MRGWTAYADALVHVANVLICERGSFVGPPDARKALHDELAHGRVTGHADRYLLPRDFDGVTHLITQQDPHGDASTGPVPIRLIDATPESHVWRYGKAIAGEPNSLSIPDEFLDEDGCPSSFGFGGRLDGLQVRSDDLTRAFPEPASVSPLGRSGRKPKVDWSAVKEQAFALMEYHGDFNINDREWNAQARLEQELVAFCQEKLKTRIEPNTVRERLPDWLSEWRLRSDGR